MLRKLGGQALEVGGGRLALSSAMTAALCIMCLPLRDSLYVVVDLLRGEEAL